MEETTTIAEETMAAVQAAQPAVTEEIAKGAEEIAQIPEAVNIVENTAQSIMETTSPFINWIKGFITWDNFFKFLGVALLITALWFLYKLIVKGIRKANFPKLKLDDHKKEILIRFVKYLFYVIVAVQVLGLLGINFSALWGAAGIAGVAVGFAAQTSVSNLISGLFVITEGSLKLGDLIEIDNIEGYVEAINLLSVRIRTFDNQMVRIPNSTVIGSNLINISYHKARRLKVVVSISYDTDMEKALKILSTAPDLCPTILKDPAPAAWFESFGDSGINMILAVWFSGDNLRATKNEVFVAIKKVFDNARIEIPFNQLDVKIKE